MDAPKSTVSILVTRPGATARSVAVRSRLFVGRTCLGIDARHRLILDGAGVSRDHCQIQVHPGSHRASLVDTSTNGTRLNGTLVQRSVAVPLTDGDVIAVGHWSLVYRQTVQARSDAAAPTATIRSIQEVTACLVCGDLVDYTTLTEAYGGQAVFAAMHTIFDRLRALLLGYQGTLYDYIGDAFLALWEESGSACAAATAAARFAIAATAEVAAVAPSLPIRRLDGTPLSMGWAVTHGGVAMSAYAGPLAGLIGDPVNVGFRLAGLAGREGRSPVLITSDAVRAGAGIVGVGPEESVTVKGRREAVAVHQLALPARAR